MCSCSKHRALKNNKIKKTYWFTQVSPAEKYIFFHFKSISVSYAVIKVLRAEESVWFYKIWSNIFSKRISYCSATPVYLVCLVLLAVCLIHPEE